MIVLQSWSLVLGPDPSPTRIKWMGHYQASEELDEELKWKKSPEHVMTCLK